ncbi:response regulator [Bradyrhizobium sp. MOS001]|uniref:response regulator n=1 Tax=Bradyrhizobium sp. MOS001 TaxID=2133948 RepID=UPI0031B9BCC1
MIHCKARSRISCAGEEALTLFRCRVAEYRALVTDVSLKGRINGWEVAKQIREIAADFPVVYMTGAAADQSTSHVVPNSILLQKPFAPTQLVTAVTQLLNGVGNGAQSAERVGPPPPMPRLCENRRKTKIPKRPRRIL